MSDRAIADYALLSDCRSAALVSSDGSIDWLCARRFDGPAIFARILDADAGYWRLGAAESAPTSRRYIESTMALETVIDAAGGQAVVTDAMVVGPNEQGHDLAASAPGVVVRRVECTRGDVELAMEWRPRPEFGLVTPLFAPLDGGVSARGGADVMVLSSTVACDVAPDGARTTFALHAGERALFAMKCGVSWEAAPQPHDAAEMQRHLDDTLEAWRSWSALHQRYEGPWRELVHHSGRVLQALTFQPTGAIVAAPTTSLPEAVGASRNWDYRFTWVRDASLTMDALWIAACPDEAHRFFWWMSNAVAAQIANGADLQIMFGVGGEHDLSERELPHLRGWRNSAPVRVGNGAWTQRQIDVYGELLGAARSLSRQLTGLDAPAKRFLRDAADTAAVKWSEKGQGIWEIRGEPRHFLYSKLMRWVALDAAIDIASLIDSDDRAPAWRAKRDEIRDTIIEQGWSHDAGAFTQTFGGSDLDASNLVMALVGFLPGDDARLRATVRATAEQLTDSCGLVYRYRAHDGLEGDEGTFLLCTFWLAQAQAVIGDVDAATATMERAVSYANDVGLLAEEVDGATGELLGNYPQAFSHIGLINAAWAITRSRTGGSAADAPEDVL
ncbi:MAG: glycoside hydrolase family 15 protein [Candidatus Dormibacteria bacterium]